MKLNSLFDCLVKGFVTERLWGLIGMAENKVGY